MEKRDDQNHKRDRGSTCRGHGSRQPDAKRRPWGGTRLGTRCAAEPHSHAATLAGRRKDGLRQNDSLTTAKEGRFPRSVHLTGHSVRWIEAEVDTWLMQQAQARIPPPQR